MTPEPPAAATTALQLAAGADFSIFKTATVVVKAYEGKEWRDVLTAFLKPDDRHFAGDCDFDSILRAARDALSASDSHVLATQDSITINAASDFRCLLLAVATGRRDLDTDVFGNQCLTFKLVHQASPKAAEPVKVPKPSNILTAAPMPTILQWSSVGQFGEVVSEINTYLESSLGNLDKVNTTRAKITTITKRTNSLFEKTSKLLQKLQLISANRKLSDKTTATRSPEGSAKRAATAAPTVRISTGKEISPEPLSKMAKRDVGDVHTQRK